MEKSLEVRLNEALQQATRQRQRVCLRLSGERTTVRSRAAQLPQIASNVSPLYNTDPQGNTQNLQQLSKALGSTTSSLIFDAFAGFDPDALAMLAGTLRGPGLLVILTPPIDDWQAAQDPLYDRLAVYPEQRESLPGRYLARFKRLFCEQGISGVEPDLQWQLIAPAPKAPACSALAGPTTDQRSVMDAVSGLFMQDEAASHCLLVHADRGRGKSSALGMAAQALSRQYPGCKLLLTAPNRRSADQVFAHVDEAANLQFLGPDEIVRRRQAADLLIVDEAAAIPLPLLQSLVLQYPRTVFASTLYGYEGAGRGFAVRFHEFLTAHKIQTRTLRLEQPIRYAAGDWLEQSLNAWLIPTSQGTPADVNITDPLSFQQLDRDQLACNERLLGDLFGLLVEAHYQTRPLDLQHLLDGPNVELFTLQHGDSLLAAAWIAREGNISDDTLCDAILDGQRRPRGHLLAQRLAYEHMEKAFLGARLARVVRIAVQPNLQQQGLGSQLLTHLIAQYRKAGFDAIGSAFGDAPSLAQFWQSRGFGTVHLGNKPNAASGYGSRFVARAVTETLQSALARAQTRATRKSALFSADALLSMPGAQEELRRFIAGRRDIDASRQVLRAVFSALQDTIETQNYLKVLEKPLKPRQKRAFTAELRQFLADQPELLVNVQQ